MCPRRLSRRASGASAHHRVSAVAIAIALLSGGCAATTSGPSYVSGPVSAYPGDAPPPPPPPTQTTRVEIEADGLPAQLAPRNPRPIKDDPTEPWSPNYGRGKSAEAAEPARSVPARIAVAQIAPAAAPSSTPVIDADDIIRRAIAAHEMRQN